MPRFMAMLVALAALAGCQTLLDVSLGSNPRGDLDVDVDEDEPGEVTTADAGQAPAVPVGSGDKTPSTPAPDAGSEEPFDMDAGLDEPQDDAGLDDGTDIDGDGPGGPDGFDGDGRGGPDGDGDGARGGG